MIRKILFKIAGGVIKLKTKNPNKKGNVLLSYTTLPFLNKKSLDGHSNRWECWAIAQIFLELGYDVDVIDYTNNKYPIKNNYAFCLDIHNNFQLWSKILNKNCIKIFHITGAHWEFQNKAEQERIKNIFKRKGVLLSPTRQVPPSHNLDYADFVTIIGNDFTIGTYNFNNKKFFRVPISTTHTYQTPESKNYSKAKNNFIWLGGAGMAHKGLDLVLEAFAKLPQYTLTVLGKKDEDFAQLYHKELFETPNIKYEGLVNLGSQKFIDIINNSISTIFPSCSEGTSGGVITAMHAGLIPIVSYESGVDVKDFGIILKENSVEEIIEQIKIISSLPNNDLKDKAMATWTYAQTNHTREHFRATYKNIIQTILQNHDNII